MFENNQELIAFIKELIEKLQAIGEGDWANAFENALAISFMPGELLGAVRNSLRSFSKTEFPDRLNLEWEINAAIEALDQALNR